MSRYLPPEPYERVEDHAERALLAVMWDARQRFRRALDDLNGSHSPTESESYAWERDRARATIRDCVAALRVWRVRRAGVTSGRLRAGYVAVPLTPPQIDALFMAAARGMDEWEAEVEDGETPYRRLDVTARAMSALNRTGAVRVESPT